MAGLCLERLTMVTEDKSREGNMAKSTKTSKVTKFSGAITGGHREVTQRTARLYDDREKVIYEESLGESSCTGTEEGGDDKEDRWHKIVPPTEIASNGTIPSDMREKSVHEEASPVVICDLRLRGSSGQVWSGTEDDITEEPDLTSVERSSSLSFLDWQNRDDSDVQTTLAIEVDINKTEVVLIDEDDDMSLREKTVTDVSMMDGNAAELVCGRLLSISTDSSSECKQESLAAETPLPASDEIKKRRCCFCTIL
ncbi:paralemmin-2 [Alosa sapidissima]|uniref:paralemmin-2 n=1 Tax=Alosa sapidissima TaxID=34773 RepID=UPI001C083EF6|nr:paralemmin-2 [Alosa sapidissima]